MAKCPNCGKALSCGCQMRKTKDGRTGCSSCITKLQANDALNSKVSPDPNAPRRNRI